MPDDNTAVTPSMPPVDPGMAAPAMDAQPDVAPEPAVTPGASALPEPGTVPEPSDVPSASDVPEPSAPVATTPTPSDAAAADPIAPPFLPDPDYDENGIYAEVAGKIRDSRNVLIALSSDPSVDEMAAAIGLSLYLDKLGKRATAIYSGSTPNALEFLKPEETFEPTADTLQDFVIAVSKDKADHLRYKIDGDYVKIYITPYKTRIAEEDLDFSYGDFNVDLVLALDVTNGIDLDSALREHGRIMHDAVIVNITTGNPGKFGEIEWSDKKASSVSEMIAKLLYNVSGAVINKDEATAFLTGIVAATNRFSNANTTPETMQIASRLMRSGANQQLISKNITPDVENEMFSLTSDKPVDNSDPTKLDINHQGGEPGDAKEGESDKTEKTKKSGESKDEKKSDKKDDKKDKADKVDKADEKKEADGAERTLLDDLKAAEESLSQAGAEAVPETEKTSVKIDSENGTSNMDETTGLPVTAPAQDKVLQPGAEFNSKPMTLEDETKYSKMLEDAISDPNGGDAAAAQPVEPVENPAAMNAPAVAEAPEINGVPEMNYMPMPNEEILPPPPTPPIDMSGVAPVNVMAGTPEMNPAMPPAEPIAPAAPAVPPEPNSLGDQPAMQDQVYGPQVTDPGAFKIPGM